MLTIPTRQRRGRTNFLSLSLPFSSTRKNTESKHGALFPTLPKGMKLSEEEGIQNSIPEDIALKIASSLQLCASDCVWESLYRDRWPAFDLGKDSSAQDIKTHQFDQQIDPSSMGWRACYIDKHNEMDCRATVVVNFVEHCSSTESIEVGHHLSAIEGLCSMQLGFKDVQMFFFKPRLGVLVNLIGLHYCLSWLGIPAVHLREALDSCKITEREVCVRWWKLGMWFHGYRLRDESHSRTFSLVDIATEKEGEVLGVLHRGAIHEVLRVQISVAKPVSTPWSVQSPPAQN